MSVKLILVVTGDLKIEMKRIGDEEENLLKRVI